MKIKEILVKYFNKDLKKTIENFNAETGLKNAQKCNITKHDLKSPPYSFLCVIQITLKL